MIFAEEPATRNILTFPANSEHGTPTATASRPKLITDASYLVISAHDHEQPAHGRGAKLGKADGCGGGGPEPVTLSSGAS